MALESSSLFSLLFLTLVIVDSIYGFGQSIFCVWLLSSALVVHCIYFIDLGRENAAVKWRMRIGK